MTISVVTTPGGASANSYISVANADAYVDLYLLSETARDAWADLEADTKARLLIQATRQIDWYYSWQGYKTNDNQALAWPRQAVWDGRLLLDSNTIPSAVADATVEMALWLSSVGDDSPQTGDYQFDEIAVGSIRVNFNEKANGSSKIYMPDKVVSLLQAFGTPANPDLPSSSKARSIQLERG